jgi:mono/diheme cytochrome c family protein
MAAVTEIPEHLLRRSRERRAALGLGGDEAPAAPAETSSAPAPTAGTAAAPAPAAPAPARQPRPAPAAPPPRKPDPPYIVAAKRRKRIPIWAMPVVGLLPLWGYLYARSLEPPTKKLTGPVGAGQVIFASKCSSCHGPNGEGGVGYPLNNGEVEKSFSNITDQFSFVYTGNKPYAGKPYGTGRHIGGQRGAPGAMPAWGQNAGGELTDAQINEVVCYERYGLGGGDQTSKEYADWCSPDAPNFAAVESGGFASANVQIKLNG